MVHTSRFSLRWFPILSILLLFTLVLSGCEELEDFLPEPAGSNQVTTVPTSQTSITLPVAGGNPSITQFESPYTDGRVNIILARPDGDPYYYTEKPGAPGALTEFTLKMRKNLGVYGGSAVDARVLAKGGTRINTDEGDSSQAGYIGICGGYCLREWLRSMGNVTPKGGWFTDPTDTWKKLYGSGLIVNKPIAAAAPNDLVFWFVNPPTGGSIVPSDHAAIVQSINPTIVRNKDETSLVFTASLDAEYFKDDANLEWQKKHGNPTIWRSTEGKVAMMTDTSKSGYPSSAGDVYLQNVKLVINVPQVPNNARSILITVEGDDNVPHLQNIVFRKGLAVARQVEQEMILPLGNKIIRVELKDVSPDEAEKLGTGTSLANLSGLITLTDDNYFKPFVLTYNLEAKTEPSPSLILKTHTEYYSGTQQVHVEYIYYERGGQVIKHGSFKLYSPKGELETSGNYADNREDGAWKSYVNGKLFSECVYKKGVLDGPAKSYYPSGQLMNEWIYKDGTILPGTEKYYNEDGSIRSSK